MQATNGKSEFQVNGVPFWKAKPFHAKLGETQLWIVKNDTNGIIRFICTASSSCRSTSKAQPIRPLAWKDTVNVPDEGRPRGFW